MLKALLLLIGVSVAVADGKKKPYPCFGLLAGKPNNVVVFGDSLSDTGDSTCNTCNKYMQEAVEGAESYCQRPKKNKNLCFPAWPDKTRGNQNKRMCSRHVPPCRTENVGFVGIMKNQSTSAKAEQFLAGHASIGYNSYRWSNKQVWPEYLGRLFRNNKCTRMPEPISYAVSGSRASGDRDILPLLGDGTFPLDSDAIKIGNLSSQVDTYLLSKTANNTDIVIIWMGGNDMSDALFEAGAAAARVVAIYKATITYLTTQKKWALAEPEDLLNLGLGLDVPEAKIVLKNLRSTAPENVEGLITEQATLAYERAAAAKVFAAITGIVNTVDGLLRKNYTNVLVIAPPPLHLAPQAINTNATGAASILGAQFGAGLQGTLGSFVPKFGDAVKYVDFNAAVTEKINRIKKKGNGNDMCLLTSDGRPRFSGNGKDCTGYAFVDTLHPANTVHIKIAREMFKFLNANIDEDIIAAAAPIQQLSFITDEEYASFTNGEPMYETGTVPTTSGAGVAQSSALFAATLAAVVVALH